MPLTEKPTQIPTNMPGICNYHYLATVDVTLPSISGPVTVRMGRIFQLQNRSPWSYAIFSNGDLEIHPGANMSITGDVHTNGDMYLGAGGSPITFSGNVEASGTITKGKSPLDPSSRNSTNTTIKYEIEGNPRTGVEAQTPLGISQSALSGTDSNQNNDSYREVIETAVDVSNNPDPFSPSNTQTLRYYNMADYKIVISSSDSKLTSDATVTVLDSNNNVLSTSSDEYKALVDGYTSGGTTYQPILNTTGTMQDSREAVTMKLTTVDVGNIKAAVSRKYLKPTVSGDGILLYISDNRPAQAAVADIPAVYNKKGQLVTAAVPGNPAMEPAVFLDNGSSLPANGLTIVSGNPVYIQGDYNTGVSNPTSLASNNPSLASGTTVAANTANNYWEPAAVIGDAITVLSNTWTRTSTGSTAASPTTINAAFMSGSLPSDGVSYSGGIENFPRFLEKWDNVRFTYYGSMVWLYQCQQATEPWGKSNVYSAPKRWWFFDTHFYLKPPPGTFVFSAYQKLRWFQR